MKYEHLYIIINIRILCKLYDFYLICRSILYKNINLNLSKNSVLISNAIIFLDMLTTLRMLLSTLVALFDVHKTTSRDASTRN